MTDVLRNRNNNVGNNIPRRPGNTPYTVGTTNTQLTARRVFNNALRNMATYEPFMAVLESTVRFVAQLLTTCIIAVMAFLQALTLCVSIDLLFYQIHNSLCSCIATIMTKLRLFRYANDQLNHLAAMEFAKVWVNICFVWVFLLRPNSANKAFLQYMTVPATLLTFLQISLAVSHKVLSANSVLAHMHQQDPQQQESNQFRPHVQKGFFGVVLQSLILHIAIIYMLVVAHNSSSTQGVGEEGRGSTGGSQVIRSEFVLEGMLYLLRPHIVGMYEATSSVIFSFSNVGAVEVSAAYREAQILEVMKDSFWLMVVTYSVVTHNVIGRGGVAATVVGLLTSGGSAAAAGTTGTAANSTSVVFISKVFYMVLLFHQCFLFAKSLRANIKSFVRAVRMNKFPKLTPAELMGMHDEHCVVCLNAHTERSVRLPICGHVLHAECLEQVMREHAMQCPICRTGIFEAGSYEAASAERDRSEQQREQQQRQGLRQRQRRIIQVAPNDTTIDGGTDRDGGGGTGGVPGDRRLRVNVGNLEALFDPALIAGQIVRQSLAFDQNGGSSATTTLPSARVRGERERERTAGRERAGNYSTTTGRTADVGVGLGVGIPGIGIGMGPTTRVPVVALDSLARINNNINNTNSTTARVPLSQTETTAIQRAFERLAAGSQSPSSVSQPHGNNNSSNSSIGNQSSSSSSSNNSSNNNSSNNSSSSSSAQDESQSGRLYPQHSSVLAWSNNGSYYSSSTSVAAPALLGGQGSNSRADSSNNNNCDNIIANNNVANNNNNNIRSSTSNSSSSDSITRTIDSSSYSEGEGRRSVKYVLIRVVDDVPEINLRTETAAAVETSATVERTTVIGVPTEAVGTQSSTSPPQEQRLSPPLQRKNGGKMKKTDQDAASAPRQNRRFAAYPTVPSATVKTAAAAVSVLPISLPESSVSAFVAATVEAQQTQDRSEAIRRGGERGKEEENEEENEEGEEEVEEDTAAAAATAAVNATPSKGQKRKLSAAAASQKKSNAPTAAAAAASASSSASSSSSISATVTTTTITDSTGRTSNSSTSKASTTVRRRSSRRLA